MTYGVVVDVPAPVELYDAMHAEVLRTGSSADGLLLHVARATPQRFQVLEVWESRAAYDRYSAEVVGPVLERLAGGQAPPPVGDGEQAFAVRGLVIPSGGIVV